MCLSWERKSLPKECADRYQTPHGNVEGLGSGAVAVQFDCEGKAEKMAFQQCEKRRESADLSQKSMCTFCPCWVCLVPSRKTGSGPRPEQPEQ